ncbi:hypothetical protein OCU04_008366 [Sclerotinia nivalis]|uniref:C2H2-type domain-containing protein n=1 Tax=Sclerotinia nivalis TaxID=352851 RepID=A0A9X0DJL2_9HELO|nr:hypothetical protein OCU04_008366 [Sclerotinia nivalis]
MFYSGSTSSPKKNKIQPSKETPILPTMASKEGSPSSWSLNADEIPYAYNEFAWGTDIDANTIDIEWDQSWLERTLSDSESPQNTSNSTGGSIQGQPRTNFSEVFHNSSDYTADGLDELSLPPWDSLNGISDLPDLYNVDEMLSVPLTDNMSGSVTHSLPLLDFSIGPTFQTSSTELLANDIYRDPFQTTFNETEAQQADENYSLISDPYLPLLDNSDWHLMQSPPYMSPSTGVYLPSLSPITQSPTSTANFISSPTQSSTTNTSNSMLQSTSNSTTSSSDRSPSNTPPSEQNEYTCTICPKTFSKRFEFNKHTPLHTLPHTCTLCPHRTARRRDMTRHMAAKHKDVGPSGPKPVSKPICPVEDCKRSFARPDHLLRHLRRKHPGYELRS